MCVVRQRLRTSSDSQNGFDAVQGRPGSRTKPKMAMGMVMMASC